MQICYPLKRRPGILPSHTSAISQASFGLQQGHLGVWRLVPAARCFSFSSSEHCKVSDFLLPLPTLNGFGVTLGSATRNYPPPSSTRWKGCSFQEAALSLDCSQENPTDISPSRVHPRPYCSQLQPYGHATWLSWLPATFGPDVGITYKGVAWLLAVH